MLPRLAELGSQGDSGYKGMPFAQAAPDHQSLRLGIGAFRRRRKAGCPKGEYP